MDTCILPVQRQVFWVGIETSHRNCLSFSLNCACCYVNNWSLHHHMTILCGIHVFIGCYCMHFFVHMINYLWSPQLYRHSLHLWLWSLNSLWKLLAKVLTLQICRCDEVNIMSSIISTNWKLLCLSWEDFAKPLNDHGTN